MFFGKKDKGKPAEGQTEGQVDGQTEDDAVVEDVAEDSVPEGDDAVVENTDEQPPVGEWESDVVNEGDQGDDNTVAESDFVEDEQQPEGQGDADVDAFVEAEVSNQDPLEGDVVEDASEPDFVEEGRDEHMDDFTDAAAPIGGDEEPAEPVKAAEILQIHRFIMNEPEVAGIRNKTVESAVRNGVKQVIARQIAHFEALASGFKTDKNTAKRDYGKKSKALIDAEKENKPALDQAKKEAAAKRDEDTKQAGKDREDAIKDARQDYADAQRQFLRQNIGGVGAGVVIGLDDDINELSREKAAVEKELGDLFKKNSAIASSLPKAADAAQIKALTEEQRAILDQIDAAADKLAEYEKVLKIANVLRGAPVVGPTGDQDLDDRMNQAQQAREAHQQAVQGINDAYAQQVEGINGAYDQAVAAAENVFEQAVAGPKAEERAAAEAFAVAEQKENNARSEVRRWKAHMGEAATITKDIVNTATIAKRYGVKLVA